MTKTKIKDNQAEVKDNKSSTFTIQKAFQIKRKNNKTKKANTKSKGEVRGGGKKPWKQKGTGNARAGSSRSPLWRSGGIIFGPKTVETRNKKINKKENDYAIKEIVKLKSAQKTIKHAKIDFKTSKTNEALSLLKQLQIDSKVLIITKETQPLIELAFNNISYATVKKVNGISIIDFINYKYILFDEDVYQIFKEKYHV